MSELKTAATAHGVDWRMLAAIGVRESGFLNINEQGGGKAVGIFQIDLGKNPRVTAEQASDLVWAANWAAATLAGNRSKLEALYEFDAAHLTQATAASWNLGVGGISGNPNTIDVGSARENYGSNVVNLMDCFQ